MIADTGETIKEFETIPPENSDEVIEQADASLGPVVVKRQSNAIFRFPANPAGESSERLVENNGPKPAVTADASEIWPLDEVLYVTLEGSEEISVTS
jgi:hypothetical protein